MKIDGWGTAGAILGIGTAIFGIAKGFHDKKVSEQKQADEISKAVEKYMINNNPVVKETNE